MVVVRLTVLPAAERKSLASMAKFSKTHQFDIYEDGVQVDAAVEHIPEADMMTHSLRGGPRATFSRTDSAYSQQKREEGEQDQDADTNTTLLDAADHDLDDGDDERRESAFTSASVSSLPESAFETDYERGGMHKPYTPPMLRPSFRRPESVRRMQMSSPAPSEKSLRRSVFSPPRIRTPRPTRSGVKGSPRRQKWEEEEPEQDKKDYPLVLLHMTILPVELRWSRQSMEEVLPSDTLENLQLLQSKISSTILQRGILIPHPKDEYEILEERLLEALELKKERVTRCGHFRARHSTSSASSADSGVGSSVEGLDDGNSCETCNHHLKTVGSAIGAGGRKWTIKVFAANGLMRASAWTAAWAEMESVDVEILPWIADDLRKTLDARALEEVAEEHAKQEEEEVHRMIKAEQQFRIEEARSWDERAHEPTHANVQELLMSYEPTLDQHSLPSSKPSDDLPQVYRPKDIPLSLLLKNYVFLLARDKRNVIIVGLAILALFATLRASLSPGTNSTLPSVCENMQAPYPVLQHINGGAESGPSESADTSSKIEQTEASYEATTTADEDFTSSSDAQVVRDATEDMKSELVGDELFQKNEALAERNPSVIEDFAWHTDQCPNLASITHLFAIGDQTKV